VLTQINPCAVILFDFREGPLVHICWQNSKLNCIKVVEKGWLDHKQAVS